MSSIGRMGQLVRVTTAQKAELTGFYAPADRRDAPTIVYTHGLSGSFDTNFMYTLLATPGVEEFNILSTTSTGAGNIATTRRGEPPVYRLTGSAFEVFSDCIHDLNAWLDYAAQRSTGPVILWGHSLGASKVTHYLGTTGDKRIKGLVLASPSDVTGGFMDNVGHANFPVLLKEAEELVHAGRPEALMHDKCVIGLLKQRISAGTVIDRFEDGKPADVFDFYGRGSSTAFKDLARISQPILVLYCETGELVGPKGVQEAIEVIRQKAVQCPKVESVIVGGNHWYMGHEHKAMSSLLNWSRQVTS